MSTEEPLLPTQCAVPQLLRLEVSDKLAKKALCCKRTHTHSLFLSPLHYEIKETIPLSVRQVSFINFP